MRMFWQTSPVTRAVLWLWENDADNWVIGSHAVVHEPTGVAIWIANETYGIKIFYDVPNEYRARAHVCSGGKELAVPRQIDRKALRNAVDGRTGTIEDHVARQISDWATEKIRNDVGDRTVARFLP